tara:strand:+ start:8421 stop:9689 length:1269 start_codon:yes stop_codon:yes gene_type:complete
MPNKKIKIIAITDLEHSAPRISNLLYYLDDNLFDKFVIGSNYDGFLNQDDMPINFDKKIKLLTFKRKINFYRSIKKSVPINKINSRPRFSSFFLLIKKIFLNIFLNLSFPDQYIFTLKNYIKIFDDNFQNLNENIVIFSSFPYATSHIAAYKIKKKNKNVVWIADYRDLWSKNQVYSFIKLRYILDSMIEKKIMKYPDKILTVTNPWAQKQQDFLKKEVGVIYNGYQEFSTSNLIQQNFPELEEEKIYVLYVGAIYFKGQDVNLFFESISNLKSKNIEFHFMGKHYDELSNLIDRFSVGDNVKHIGQYSRKDSQIIQKKYDYLMFFDFFTDSAVLTLKFYEYIGANKPIICIGGKKNSESKKILNQISRGYILEKEDQIIDFFENKITKKGMSFDKQKSSMFSYRYRSQQLEELIFNLINKR